MYRIIETLDGKIRCECQVQDGTERWESRDIETAIREMKSTAKALNHIKIKKSDIAMLKEVTECRCVVVAK